jgi:hypothetical protein
MTALPSVDHMLKCKLEWAIGEDNSALNGLYIAWANTTPSSTALDSLASQINTCIEHHMASFHLPEIQLLGVNLLDLSSDEGAEGHAAGYGSGTGGGPFLGANTCTLVNYGLNVHYRGGKPRSYFPFGSGENLLNPQTWKPEYVSKCSEAWYDTLVELNGLAASGTTLTGLRCVSYYKKGEWIPDPVTGRPRYIPQRKEPPETYEIGSVTVNVRPGSQRRRLRAG